jgi:hypothetical protein
MALRAPQALQALLCRSCEATLTYVLARVASAAVITSIALRAPAPAPSRLAELAELIQLSLPQLFSHPIRSPQPKSTFYCS